MTTTIPNEVIAKIVGYVSNHTGFDYRFCRYRKTWRFVYNKNNKIARLLNNLVENKWCVRRFYDMSEAKNKALESLPNFTHFKYGYMGIIYYTPLKPTKNANPSVRVNMFTTVNGDTVINLYKNGSTVEYLFHKITIYYDCIKHG